MFVCQQQNIPPSVIMTFNNKKKEEVYEKQELRIKDR
jgi:hypothetical protein